MTSEHHNDETQPSADTVRMERLQPKRRIGRLGGSQRAWPVGYLPLWLITICSLLLNVVILRHLDQTRQAGQQAVLDAIVVVENLKTRAFSEIIVVDRTLEIDTDMPVEETIPLSINETIPVNTVVTVPVNVGPLGTFPIDIPISTSIPVDLDVEIEIDQTFHVNTAVPVHFEVPVEIAVEDTPLYGTLGDIQARLEALAEQLGQPILRLPGKKPEGASVDG